MKKIINIGLLASLILFGCTKSANDSALYQNETQSTSVSTLASDRKITTSHFFTYPNLDFYLWCDNNLIDHFLGDMNLHCTMQYENDVLVFMNMEYSGSYTGENTGEVVKFKEITRDDLSKSDNRSFHMNVVGNKGSHFIISGTYLTQEPWVVIDKAICE